MGSMMHRLSRTIAVVCHMGALYGLTQPSFAADLPALSPAAKAQLAKLDEPIVLRGDYFRAVQAAYADFVRELDAKRAFSNTQSPDTAELIRWLSRIENYDIHVERTRTSYEVEFDVTLRNNAPMVFGGGARYLVDTTTFAITQKTLLK
jgi:hypothetical protein